MLHALHSLWILEGTYHLLGTVKWSYNYLCFCFFQRGTKAVEGKDRVCVQFTIMHVLYTITDRVVKWTPRRDPVFPCDCVLCRRTFMKRLSYVQPCANPLLTPSIKMAKNPHRHPHTVAVGRKTTRKVVENTETGISRYSQSTLCICFWWHLTKWLFVEV